MGFFRQVAEYLYIKKRDPNARRDTNIKLMHGMNRISLLIFLAALVFMLVKFVVLPMFK